MKNLFTFLTFAAALILAAYNNAPVMGAVIFTIYTYSLTIKTSRK